MTDLRSQEVAWLVNDNGPYRVDAIRDGELAGYTGVTDTASNNLIVENLMINDDRNGSNYRCVMIQAEDTLAFTEESDPTILYVAGELSTEIIDFCMCCDNVIIIKHTYAAT